MTGKWASSNRRAQLPKDWHKRVNATKSRAGGWCEGITLNGEPRWHVPDCDRHGHECDHDQPGDNHSLDNLRWLSSPCHTRKTQHEAKAAKPQRRRQPEQHPGRLT